MSVCSTNKKKLAGAGEPGICVDNDSELPLLSGDISERDGLLATWYHRANSKEEMNKALTMCVRAEGLNVTNYELILS
uniref:Uncharacterized protein n=1 Tax=Sparus aurata TaxID=8175 RepID=A0A671Y005_SPAAU